MKIAIITLNDNNNYGNRLQNYAMEYLLKNYGEPHTIIRNISWRKVSFVGKCLRQVKLDLDKYFGKCGLIYKTNRKRLLNFKKFNENINLNYKFKFKSTKINDSFDFFVVGSDQIWNPLSYEQYGYVNFLQFADANKRVAIAPSIAKDSLTEEQIKILKESLKNFYYLSCREQQGSNIITRLTGRECTTLIDPTLMLSTSDWNKVSKKPKYHDEHMKYILLYILGELTEEYKKIITDISNKYGLKIINISDKNSIYYTTGPSEFIYLISHCTIMLTDSFHGAVFSYIYNKPFRIFKRVNGMNMNSRLTNLISVLHLGDLFINENTSIEKILETNFDKSYLDVEQKKFKDYLNMVFYKEQQRD